MTDPSTTELWFATGSQHLYGPEALAQVGAHAQQIAASLSRQPAIPVGIVFKPVVTTADEVRGLCREANGECLRRARAGPGGIAEKRGKCRPLCGSRTGPRNCQICCLTFASTPLILGPFSLRSLLFLL